MKRYRRFSFLIFFALIANNACTRLYLVPTYSFPELHYLIFFFSATEITGQLIEAKEDILKMNLLWIYGDFFIFLLFFLQLFKNNATSEVGLEHEIIKEKYYFYKKTLIQATSSSGYPIENLSSSKAQASSIYKNRY